MEHSYLIELLQTLSKSELEDLHEFIQSPYLNREKFKKETQLLLEYLIPGLTNPPLPHLDKVKIFEYLFPGQEYKEGKIDKVMNYLNNLTRKYLLIEAQFSEENDLGNSLSMAKILRKRGLISRYQQHMSKLGTSLYNQNEDSLQFRFNAFLYESEAHIWEGMHNKFKNMLNIPKVLGALDLYYHLYRLTLLNRYLLQKKATHLGKNHEVEAILMQGIHPQEPLQQNMLLSIQFQIHQYLCDVNFGAERLIHLKQSIEEAEKMLEVNALAEAYGYLRNILTMLSDSGMEEAIILLHEVQKKNLQQGYFFVTQNAINPSAFLNIVIFGMRNNQMQWTKEFLENYGQMIAQDTPQREYYYLNLALYYYEIGQPDKALEILPVGVGLIYYHLTARRLELKIYYDTNSPLLTFKIDAYKMYINRASKEVLSLHLKERENNFVHMLSQINNTIPGDKARIERLIAKVHQKNLIAERFWLLDRLEKIGGKRKKPS